MRKTDLQVPKTHLNQKEKHNPFPIFFSPFYFILLIILLIGGNITAQVIIKEKVEIDPQNQILPNNPTQNYNFRVEVDWDAEEVQANNHFWNANLQVNTALINSCDEFVTETGFTYGWPTGSNSLELQANAYRYKILVTISGFYDSYQFVDLIVRTYLNNNLRHTFTQRVNSGIWTYFSETRTAEFNEWLYLVESFHFSIDDELIGYGCFYTVNLRTNTEGSCGSSVVASLEYDPINLTIIKGSEYLTFYDNRTNEDAGSSIQVMPQYFNKIDLRYQNPLRDTVSKIGVVQLESNGIVETDSIEILHAPDDLNVSVYPEEITTGEEAELYLFIDYCPPPGTKINIEIIKGQKYGGLIDPYTNEKSKIITNLDHMFGYAWVDYVADSLSAVATDSVIFRVTTTDPEIVPKEAILIIKPPPLKVIIDPPQLTAGDTVDIIIKKRNPDGSLEDFPPNQEFEIAKLEGCLFGDVLIGDSLNYYFADAKQPVKFVVADSLVSDSGVVKLRVGLVENYESINQKYNGKKLRAGKYIEKGKEEWRLKLEKLFAEKRNETLKLMPNGLSSSCYIGYFITETCWQGDVPIGKPKLEILLGETKYYQARYNEGKLVIDELSGPNLWNGGLSEDVWGNTPVSIVEGGDKLGVYWEKEKPIWNGNTNLGILPLGLIRLVGRYWEEGKNYKVKLTAHSTNGDEASIVIEVKKPGKLGSSVTMAKDVFGAGIKIDELCIKWGGKLGIPPQFIKGHMRRETSSHYPFYPTYLYEPWTTQFKAFKDDKSLFTNPFFVPENATTFYPPIPNHGNVKDYHYPTSPVSVWDMIENYSTIVYSFPPGGWRKYGERQATQHASKENGVLYFYGVYKTPQNKYGELKRAADKKYDVKKNPSNEPLANNEARENFIK
ncbi:MAG: hypothetical protein Q8Q47_11530, partial [Ignavibacteriaceae bacterium]|nr:hypothetical protein [Ignavibacteriaceae bacterium]